MIVPNAIIQDFPKASVRVLKKIELLTVKLRILVIKSSLIEKFIREKWPILSKLFS